LKIDVAVLAFEAMAMEWGMSVKEFGFGFE
jgi:hypothetical protein